MITLDKGFNDFSKHIDEVTGFMHINGVIARSGIQEYYGLELSDEAEPMKRYAVFRPSEEVLNEDSLKTYINATLTDNHPDTFVTVDNIKELHKGSSASYETFNKDGIDFVKAKLIVTDKDLIEKIKDGKIEISAGYSQNLVKEDGEFQGVPYQYKQTDIRINHIAIVDAGRCGNGCKITSDNKVIIVNENKPKKGIHMAKLLIGDMEVEICDATMKHIDSLNAKIKQLDADMTEAEKEKEKLQAAKDMAEEEAKKAKEEEMDEEEIKKQVDAKVELISILKDADITIDSKSSISEMKKAYIASASKVDLTDKSEVYIDASFDALIDLKKVNDEKKESIDKSQKDAFKDMSDNKVVTDAEISKSIFAKKQKLFRKVGN